MDRSLVLFFAYLLVMAKTKNLISVNDDNKFVTFTLPEVPYYVAIPGRPAELYGTALLGSF